MSFRTVQASMEANGNAPGLLVPTGGVNSNVAQFPTASCDNGVVVGSQRDLGFPGWSYRVGLAAKPVSCGQVLDYTVVCIANCGGDTGPVFNNGLGFCMRMASEKARNPSALGKRLFR